MPRLLQESIRPHRTPALFGLGCALGVLAFFLLYGPTPLEVSNDTWLRGGFVEQDVLQHYAGWLFYRSSPLRLPLCDISEKNLEVLRRAMTRAGLL